ncbi:hypothetical protein K461DRAFT_289681 [Myriangium duriaei CBS 260.36]|uniref:DUF2423 domain-containing protein n=1 Tax=Myriangium duriaei CBS 260.36 TaxID=1168546 RepID=A0A9P4JB12_9PEZI|nr:hypothetical protein K461DRAFT_289681 [Myriangium duriaei CBS 260.36]
MAKSARSSVKKTNKARLKSRLYGPAEMARATRLSEKLAAIASTSKMDTEKEQGNNHTVAQSGSFYSLSASSESSKSLQESKENSGDTQGASRSSLSISIPQTMFSAHLPLTPPPTPPANTNYPAPDDDFMHPDESFFFHTLGVASDIKGFDDAGNLILDFDSAIRNGHG